MAALVGGTALAATQESAPPAGETLCRIGIIHACEGRLAAAESVFVSLLTQSPQDGRALTNLGNILLLRDDADLAVAFYARAAAIDTLDGGILLNRAIALATLGNEAESRNTAREGVRRAGGLAAAERLLGLPSEPDSVQSRAAAATRLRSSQVRDLLRASLNDLPADTSSTRRTRPSSTATPARHRFGGARGAAVEDAAAALYWKH